MKKLGDFPLNKLKECDNLYRIKRGKANQVYINIPLAIDIETTSTYMDGQKVAFPYIFQVGFDCIAYYTRDYREFYAWMDSLKEYLSNINKHIHCLIHNLPYEFTFFSSHIKFDNVFAKSINKPLVCEYGNIRFLDSCQMSGYSLQKLAEKYTKTQKIKDLDYKIWRVPETPLMDEYRYCSDDVIILNEYWLTDEVQAYIKPRKQISKIPLTNTAKVRMLTKSELTQDQFIDYNLWLASIYPSPEVWEYLPWAFAGGVVKSNPYYTNLVLHDLSAMDLTSAYPAAMFRDYYPMDKFRECDVNEPLQDDYCYLIHLKILNIKSIFPMRTLSISKCINLVNCRTDNGRVISADSLEICLTDIDFKYLFKFYDFDFEVIKKFKSKAGKLPRFIIRTMVKLYQRKGELKEILKSDPNNSSLKVELLNVKGRLNSLYGMMVTKDMPFNYTFQDGEFIEVPNKQWHEPKKSDFLAYQWGVFVTAHARASLYSGMLLVGANDIVYSDTDSCKFLGDHWAAVKEWNAKNQEKVKAAAEYYGVDYNIVKGLGDFDREQDIKTFKTLGAKRYYTETYDPKQQKYVEHVTIAGINDKAFCKYALTQGKTVLDFFHPDAKIPKEHTDKNTSTYIFLDDFKYYTYTYDYSHYRIPVKNYIHLEEAPWQMTLSDEYDALLSIILKEKGLI